MNSLPILMFLALWLLTVTGWAAVPPATLKLSQAHWSAPQLTGYLDIRDAAGKALVEWQPGQLAASLGDTQLPVSQIQPFANTGEGVAYIFLVDVSLSVKPDQFANIRAALSSWAEALAGADRMALLSFGDTVKQNVDFTADKTQLKQAIQSLKPAAKQTALHQGLIQATQLARRADAGLPGRRVIVVLSDGLDDLSGGPTREEVLAQAQTDRVPIYAMGLPQPKKAAAKAEEGIKALGLFARSSGGDYVSVGKQSLEKVYADMRTRIRQVAVAKLDCQACVADGRVQRLQITLQDGGLALSDGLDLRTLPSPPPPKPPTPPKPPIEVSVWEQPWVYAGLVLSVALLALGVYLNQRRKRHSQVLSMIEQETGEADVAYTVAMSPAAMAKASPVIAQHRVQLVQMDTRGRGESYEVAIADQAVIGRDPHCAVKISGDSEVSTRHCALVSKNQAVFLRDLGSTNGSQVNGVPITSDYRLQEGDVIGLGRTELRVLFIGGIS